MIGNHSLKKSIEINMNNNGKTQNRSRRVGNNYIHDKYATQTMNSNQKIYDTQGPPTAKMHQQSGPDESATAVYQTASYRKLLGNATLSGHPLATSSSLAS